MFGNQGNNPDPNENPNRNIFGGNLQRGVFPTPSIFNTDSQTNKFNVTTSQNITNVTSTYTSTTTARSLFGKSRNIDTTRQVFGSPPPSNPPNVFGSKAFPGQGNFNSPGPSSSPSSLFPLFPATQGTAFGGATTKTTSVFGSSSISSLFGGHNLKMTTSPPATTIPSLFSSQMTYSQALKQTPPVFGVKTEVSSPDIKPLMSGSPKKPTDRTKNSSRNVVPPKEHGRSRNDPRTKRLNRTVVSGGLFGQALAGIRQTKPKDSKPRESKPIKDVIKKRKNEEDVSSGSTTESQETRMTGTAEEISQLHSIFCRGIPKELNTDEFLRKHFSQFGKVSKLYRQPSKQTAHVHFSTHEEAQNAKQNGTVLISGKEPILIFWSLTSSVLKKMDSKTKMKPEKSRSPINVEVDEELQSMSHNLQDLEEDLKGRKSTKLTKDQPSTSSTRNQDKIPSAEPSQKLRQEHLDLLRIQTKTSKDRFQVLDTRDKLLRLSRIKQSNITTAKAVVGTCPDMCPEKERYFREEGGRLPLFEVADKTSVNLEVDHKLAVKEYLRSSADQEEPLPHELRPGPVLSLTMDYLICNVLDDPCQLESPAEWFDFLWNRTRAIRKDLTQQHLCDPICVSLVEKCARFHIHCAERLCEEEMICFDPKINNENLTKCLQSLKHFYHDLGVKGVENAHEAEFRGYDILLNLNSGDILRQVQQLALEIQNSPQVIFAVKVFSAVNSNNYVRFFKLVRGATYLNACILHRYFNQIRSRALQILTRAYCPPSHPPIHFPMNEFIALLGFDGANEASEFCSAHGLSVDGNDVIFDRVNFFLPNALPVAKRSVQLVESKLTRLVGEVVSGGNLPENPKATYNPHSSFDAQGYLKSESLTAEDQDPTLRKNVDTTTVVVKQEVIEEEKQLSISDQLENFNEILVKDLANLVLGQTTDDMIRNACHEVYTEMTLCYKVSQEIVDSTFDENMENFMSDVVNEVLNEEVERQKYLEEQRIAQENTEREIRAKAIIFCQDNIIEDVFVKELYGIIIEVVNEAELEHEAKTLEANAQDICESVISEVTSEAIDEITRTIYQEDVVDKMKRLEVISKRIRLIKARRFFQLWRRTLMRRKRRLRNLRFFPGVSGILAHRMTNKSALPDADLSLPMKRILRQEKLNKSIDASFYSFIIKKTLDTEPLDLPFLLPPILTSGKFLTENVYCKLFISFAPDDDSESQASISTWIKSKFRAANHRRHEKISDLYRWKSDDGLLHFCAKSLNGLLTNNDLREFDLKNEFQGVNTIWFVIVQNRAVQQECFWNEQRYRLQLLATLIRRTEPKPNVCVLSIGGTNLENEIRRSLKFDVFGKLFSRLNIIQLGSVHDINANFSLINCLKTLTASSMSSMKLQKQLMYEYLEDVIAQHFSKIVYSNLAERLQHGVMHQPPNCLISLFNSVISWAAEVVTSESIRNVAWPPPEFISSGIDLPALNWNSEDNLRSVYTKIKKLELNQIPMKIDNENWEDVKESIYYYMDCLKKDSDLKLENRIETLLNETEKKFERNCCVKHRVSNCDPFWENVCWTDVIHAFIEFKLRSAFENTTVEENRYVYYFKDDLNGFKYPRTWAESTRERQEKISPTRLSTLEKSSIKRKLENSLTETFREKRRPRISLSTEINDEKNCENRLEILLNRIKMEREEIRLLNKKLEGSTIDFQEPSFTSTPRIKEPKAPRFQSSSETTTTTTTTTYTSTLEKLQHLKSLMKSELQSQKMMDLKLETASSSIN